jgi:hypothetical protein
MQSISKNVIIIYDNFNRGILGTANSETHANALCLGILNSRFVELDESLCESLNFDVLTEHYQLPYNFPITPLPSKFITGEWIGKRVIYQRKSIFLSLWESKVKGIVSQNNDFFGNSSLMAFLKSQLDKCSPDNDFYTKPILEWAEIQEVSPNSAFQELMLRYEGHGLVHLRSHALYHKYARKISLAEKYNDIEKLYNDAITDLSLKASI